MDGRVESYSYHDDEPDLRVQLDDRSGINVSRSVRHSKTFGTLAQLINNRQVGTVYGPVTLNASTQNFEIVHGNGAISELDKRLEVFNRMRLFEAAAGEYADKNSFESPSNVVFLSPEGQSRNCCTCIEGCDVVIKSLAFGTKGHDSYGSCTIPPISYSNTSVTRTKDEVMILSISTVGFVFVNSKSKESYVIQSVYAGIYLVARHVLAGSTVLSMSAPTTKQLNLTFVDASHKYREGSTIRDSRTMLVTGITSTTNSFSAGATSSANVDLYTDPKGEACWENLTFQLAGGGISATKINPCIVQNL